MLYYVRIEDDKIIQKGELSEASSLSDDLKSISKEVYESMGDIPCSFVQTGNEITSIEYIEPIIQPEEPKKPTETDILNEKINTLQQQLASSQEAIDFILMECKMSGYLAMRIEVDKLDYVAVVTKYPQFKADIDMILINDGKENLIVG